jgi:hypothetical protein
MPCMIIDLGEFVNQGLRGGQWKDAAIHGALKSWIAYLIAMCGQVDRNELNPRDDKGGYWLCYRHSTERQANRSVS